MLAAATPCEPDQAVCAEQGQIMQHPGPGTPAGHAAVTNNAARPPRSAGHVCSRNPEAQPFREQLLGRICLWTKMGFCFLQPKTWFLQGCWQALKGKKPGGTLIP